LKKNSLFLYYLTEHPWLEYIGQGGRAVTRPLWAASNLIFLRFHTVIFISFWRRSPQTPTRGSAPGSHLRHGRQTLCPQAPILPSHF